MKRYGFLVVVAATALLAFQRGSLPVESSFGNATFRLPLGWRAVEDGGRLVVMPPDLRPGNEVFLLLMPSQALDNDFRAQFEDWVRSATPRDKPAVPGPVNHVPGNPMDMLTQLVSLGSGIGRESWFFVGFNAGGLFESHIVVASPAAAFSRYERDIQSFLTTLRYRPPSPAPATAGSWQSAQPASGALPSPPALQPKPGWAIGRAFDSSGRPLETFEVSIVNVHRDAGLYTSGYSSPALYTGRNGRYEVPLPPGVVRVTAYVQRSFEGQTLKTELQPADGQDTRTAYSAEDGVVKDFVLRASGLQAGRQPDRWGTSNIGGSLIVDSWGAGPPNVVAEVTLRPMGPLIDGSPGQVIRKSGVIAFVIPDIPLGQYDVRVTVNGRQADFELRDSDNTSYGRGPLLFRPNDAGIAGVKRMRLLVRLGWR